MIEIKFQGNSMENILRQITAFVEKTEKGEKKRGKPDDEKGQRDRVLGSGERK